MIFIFGIEYYPTPMELGEYLISDINFESYSGKTINVLEPSAGDGNLIECLEKVHNEYWNELVYNRYYDSDKPRNYIKKPSNLEIDCVEIYNDLQGILKNKGYRVVDDDFLKMRTFKNYDLIIMNPPFSNGELHLLKAIKLIEFGGHIRCILNAETIKNPYSNMRKLLVRKLKNLNAVIEYKSNAFANAERITNVEIVIIKIDLEPTKKSNILENLQQDILKEEKENEELFCSEDNGIVIKEDDISMLVQRYNEEVALSTKIIKEFDTLCPLITSDFDKNSQPILSLNVLGNSINENSDKNKLSTKDKINICIKSIREKYWYAMFENEELKKLMTREIREEYFTNLHKMCDYDFNKYNIYQLKLDLLNNLTTNLDKAIINQFDKLTSYHMEEYSSNIHYFNGWKTNKSYYINKKVIIPNYSLYSYGSFNTWHIKDNLIELEKIFTYLDNDYNGMVDNKVFKNIETILYECDRHERDLDNIDGKYFSIKLYKKGTYHIIFKDLELLKKFNLYACRDKGWLPPTYGYKHYNDMTKEEQEVIDNFEGATSYEKTMNKQDYYLNNVTKKFLT